MPELLLRNEVFQHGVGLEHAARNPAQQHAAQQDDDGETVHELENDLAAPDDDGNADDNRE